MGIQTASGLAISTERINLEVAPQAKGGGGGGFEDAFSVVRGEFKDTAYWVADFMTDADGKGTVTATLPDNLTTWVLTARGISAEALVGDKTVEIVSTRPVLVRPVAPRFFVVGDEAELKMIIQNNTREEMEAIALFEGVGLQIDGQPAFAEDTLTLPAGGKETLTYKVKVGLIDEAILRFGAKSADFEDAVELNSPSTVILPRKGLARRALLKKMGRGWKGLCCPPPLMPVKAI